MKQSISTERQLDYWLRKTEGDRHYVRLRRNHESFEKADMDEETPTTYWRCDEIELRLPIRENVEQYVEDNFDVLFDTWVNANALFNITEE